MKINSGYRPSVHLPEHAVFGSDNHLGGEVLEPSGQWSQWLPAPTEQQNIGVEPEDCTTYGTINPIEILADAIYADTTEWSERFTAYVSGTTLQGNDPWTVATTIQTKGLVPLADWPITSDLNTWLMYYAPPPSALYTKALEFIAEYDFGMEWVNTDPASLMSALQYSPLGVSGYAWELDTTTGLYVTPAGAEPCHWFTLTGYVENQYWVVFDSYENDIKHLAWDYVFSESLRYSLTTNVVIPSAWQQFLAFMKQIIGF